ncbi:MAG: T9SS type A sorting domain-containing protein [candidate division Zixibacteria bacterium]|nr:T9SS type A sorting domain-containing protein [candidate division Zixibacteria bacterium]
MFRITSIAILMTVLLISNALADPGDTIWTRTYGGPYLEMAEAINPTSDGGFIIAANIDLPEVNGDILLVKIDANGDTLWTSTIGDVEGDYAYDVIQASDGGYALTGHTSGFGAESSDMCLIKTDGLGQFQWVRLVSEPLSAKAYSVKETTFGGYVIAGFKPITETDARMRVVCYDSFGNQLSSKQPVEGVAYWIETTTDGGYIMAGKTGNDSRIVRLNSNGVGMWSRTFNMNPGLRDAAKCIIQTSKNEFAVIGDGNWNYFFLLTDSLGNEITRKEYGQPDLLESAMEIIETDDKGFLIVGCNQTDLVPEYYNCFLHKIDSLGNTVWGQTYGGDLNEDGRSVATAGDGNYLITGYTQSFEGYRDIYILKICGDYLWPKFSDHVRTPRIPGAEQTCDVSINIIDEDGSVDYANLLYDIGSGYISIPMDNVGDSFFVTVPGFDEFTEVNYYIDAYDDMGYHSVTDTYNYTVTQNYLSIDMIPINPPIIVAPGGYFTYVGILANNTPDNHTTDLWLMLDVPGVGHYGPIELINNVPLSPNQILLDDVQQDIPLYALMGDYGYIAYCGDYPSDITDSSHFPFTISGSPLNSGSDSWASYNWLNGYSGINTPVMTTLLSNYPNPFNAQTNIQFNLAIAGNVRLDIYNILGQKVDNLVDDHLNAGHHSIMWDAEKFSSGIYYYQMTTDKTSLTKKMILIK